MVIVRMLKNNATENVHSTPKNTTYQMPYCHDVSRKNMLTVKEQYFLSCCV
jgi:hypothetical protein